MFRTNENNEILDEERIKKIEAKADKIENLLAINICFSFIGCLTFMFLGGGLGFLNFIVIGFLVLYGILNFIILIKNNHESPNQSIEKEP